MNYKLLNDIDKLKNFDGVDLNERVYVYKEADKLYVFHYLKTTKKQKKCIVILKIKELK